MPDVWEIKFGLNPNDPNDAGQDADNDGASNLEEYQNDIEFRSGITEPSASKMNGVYMLLFDK